MKRNLSVAKVLLVTLISFVAVRTFTSCEKNEVWSDLDPNLIDPSAIWQQHDRWNQPGTIDGGLLTLTCDNHFGYQQYQGEYQSSCIYRMSGMNRPSIAEQLSGCYSVDTNSHELVASDGSRPGVTINHLYDTVEVAELEGDPHHTNFASYLTPCHADLYQVCFDTTNHKVVGHYRDEHGNSLIAEGEWWGVQTRIVVVHDTVDRIIRDTVVINRTDTVEVRISDTINRVIYDTVYRYEYDTINDTIIRIVERIDSVVVNITRNTSYLDQHTSWDSVQAISGGCRVWGKNTVTYIVTENGVEVDRGTQPWRHYSDFSISGIAGVNFPTSVNGGVYNVNTTTGAANVGGHTVTATNTGNHISGTVVVNGFNMTNYLTPCEPIAYQWSFNDPNATLAFRDVHGHPAGTYTTAYTTDTPTRRLISADTTYQHLSTNSTGVWSTVASTITWSCNNRRTITRHYNMAPVTETDTYNFNIGFPYVVTVSGSAQTSMLGTTVNINSGVANFGGGFTVTLTAQPRTCVLSPIPLPCQHQLLTATLTSDGVVVNGTLEGTATTGTVPVSILPPTPPIFSSVLAAAATDSYTHQIFNQASYRHTFVCVVAQIGTNYRFYWAELAPNMVRADFDSVSITATEANFYVNHLSDGYYPAMVYDHNNHTTLYRGVVSSVELGTGWQQTYRLAPSNSLAYVMGGSSWTMAGDNGRSAVRGVMNASGQIVADGITVQLY